MEFSSEVQAYTAGFMAARSRLSNPLQVSVPDNFEQSLRIIMKEVESLGFKCYFGLSEHKAHLLMSEVPKEWLTETPDVELISFKMWVAYVRGAFESNGCYTTSNKTVKNKTYSYPRIQFYFREGEEWIADFVKESWHKWLGELGMSEGKTLAVSLIPANESRTKNTFSFTVSGKKEQVISEYMYHKATITLLREDLAEEFAQNGSGSG